jgi:predicted transcriptional regulator
MSNYSNGNSGPAVSGKLDANLVHQVLAMCANETTTIIRLTHNTRLPYPTLKKYLFHLIEYEAICYRGDSGIYTITDKGLELLSILNKGMKDLMVSDSNNDTTNGKYIYDYTIINK